MANVCTGQQQIRIILTWIVRKITKVLKKAIKCLGTSTVFLRWSRGEKSNRPFAAKPSRDLLIMGATLRMPEMEKACRKHQNGQV